MSLNTNPFSKEKGFTEKGCAETILKRVYGNKGDETGKEKEMVEETNGWRNVGFGNEEVYGRVWDKSEGV
jgi:hypothetical protein